MKLWEKSPHRGDATRRRAVALRWERLEPRALLAGDVVISEIMAANAETLLDADQEASDWLELHNRADEPLDLTGWYLTDDRRELTKWQFPSVILQPDEYRVVFASDKDRQFDAGELHTNFRMQRSGEYLALVRPDGKTIEDAFDPSFPEQASDVAYGRGSPTQQIVVDATNSFQFLVPADGSLDAPVDGNPPAWASPDFDAAEWTAAAAGFGFDTETQVATVITPFTVQIIGPGATVSGSASHLINQAPPFLSSLPISAATTHSSVSESQGSWLGSQPTTLLFDLVFPTTLDHVLLWNYSFYDPVLAADTQQELGTKEFAVSFSTNGSDFTAEQVFTTSTPAGFGEPVPVEQFSVGQQAARYVRLRQISSHSESLSGLGEIAFSRGGLLDPDTRYDEQVVATDLTSWMHDADRTSLYVRTSFDVSRPESVTEMRLRMRFDDGFVAYLNGVPVASANAPVSPGWSSAATATHPDREALEFVEFDISPQQGLLRASGNVLAIQGLNAAGDRQDFLLQPELVLLGDDPVTHGFLETPTPGQPNSPRIGSPVRFSQSGGLLTSEISVALSVDNPFDTIRYTLDGREPDENSDLYLAPIQISATSQLLVRSFSPSGGAGLVQREAYLQLAPDLQDFSSNLPIFVIESFGQRISLSTTLRSTYSLVFDVSNETGRAAVTDTPHYAGRSGMRQRGRSSASFPQQQYKYETWDAEGNDRDVGLLGLPAESDWVLNGPYTDKSLMRNVVTFEWWEQLGHYSPRTRFVEVFLNADGDRELSYQDDYVGVYVLIESIKRGNNRLDIPTPEDTTDVGQITGGYVVESGNPGQFSTRTSGRNVGFQYEDPAPNELNSAQRAWIKNYIEEFETALYSPDFTHPETGKHYTQYIDVPSFVDYQIMREFTRDFDGGSTYFWIDRGGKLVMGPMWDMNWALGNVDYAEPRSVDRCGCDVDGWNYSYTTATIQEWPPWSLRLQQDPDHWQRVIDRWHELRQSVFADDNFLADIQTHFNLLSAEAADRNFARWRTLGQKTVISPPGFRERDTYAKEVEYLKDWLVQHAAWIDRQFLPAPRLSRPEGIVPAGVELQLDAELAPPGQKLVRRGAESLIHVPSDDALGTTWTHLDFQPADNWIEGRTGIGFDNSEGYASITSTDVRSRMSRSTSAFIRTEFQLDADPQSVESLTLNIKYDDGFVAYLNGTEVARSQTVTNDTPGRARASTHEAYNFEPFEISDARGLLRAGANILAIHGINASTASSDFLIIPELVAVYQGTVPSRFPVYYTTDGSDPRLPGGAISPAAQRYATPLRISRETEVLSRVLGEDGWSALESASYLVDVIPADASNLRITEVHYHPADANPAAGELDVDHDEFEFVELQNIGAQGISLAAVRLVEVDVDGNSEGIAAIFDAVSLAPGERLVVVENREAFASRYGNGIRIGGQYTGKLADGGERLTLLAADGTVIQTFSYSVQNGWPETPDGEGPSLQVIDASGNSSLAGNWRGSGPRGGTPGAAEFPVGDSNLDGLFDSSDLVTIFQAGEYEDALQDNSTWAEGDWNGDREFTSEDLVLAFQAGSYEAFLESHRERIESA